MLTDRFLDRLAYKPGDHPPTGAKFADGRGLYLLLKPSGAKLWRYNYRLDGRQYTMSLGVFPDVDLASARKRLHEARVLVAAGQSPVEARRVARRERRAAASFQAIALEWFGKHRMAPATRKRNTLILNLYLFPALGRRPVGQVTAAHVLEAVRPIERRGKHETAHRARQIASQVMRYAVSVGAAERDTTADLRGALTPVSTTHYAAVTHPEDIGALLRAIDGYGGTDAVSLALRLAPLLFVRPGELRRMEWAEVDLEAALWRIPAAKMKMRADHIVPLAPQAVAILTEAATRYGKGRYVFPSIRTASRPISDMTLNAALRRLGYTNEQMTAHGFRAMASTRLHELGYPADVIERQLAHREKNQVRAAYHRAQYLPERTAMMTAWATHLDELKTAATATTATG